MKRAFLFAVLCSACGSTPRGHGVRDVETPAGGAQDLAAPRGRVAVTPVGPSPLVEFETVIARRRDAAIAAYVDRCRSVARGDLRDWSALSPGSNDALNEHGPACRWRVAHREGGVMVDVDVPAFRRDVSLPFEPLVRPRRESARCDGAEETFVPPPLDVRAFLDLEGGYLVGYNSGEWGGGLYWYDRAGALLQVVSRTQVRWMFPTRRGALVVGGFAHQGLERGEVLRLEASEGRWTSHVLHLPSAPTALWFESEASVLLAAWAGLTRVRWGEDTEDFTLEPLHEAQGTWTHVTSIAQEPDGSIFLGAAHVVVRLRPDGDGYAEHWLVPQGPRSERRPENE